ncbi:MAG: hypothetical protein ACLFNW_01440 [Desulfobacterales bacterium]
MEKGKKTNSEFIIDALRGGGEFRSPEITQNVAKNSGKNIKIQDIASILAKLSNSEKCDLGFFIRKKKTSKGYTYSLVPEALDLPPEALYDLTRKTGKNRYTLEQIIADHPEVKRYVKSTRLKSGTVKQASKRGRKPAAVTRTAKKSASSSQKANPDDNLQALVATLVEELSEQGGLNVNVNLTIRFAGLGGSE